MCGVSGHLEGAPQVSHKNLCPLVEGNFLAPAGGTKWRLLPARQAAGDHALIMLKAACMITTDADGVMTTMRPCIVPDDSASIGPEGLRGLPCLSSRLQPCMMGHQMSLTSCQAPVYMVAVLIAGADSRYHSSCGKGISRAPEVPVSGSVPEAWKAGKHKPNQHAG